jgi:exosortase
LQLLYLALAGLAYRGLMTFGSQADLTRELEEWFFIPTETSPLVIVLLAGWLVYRRSERLARLAGEPPAWGIALPLLVLMAACYAWGLKTLAPHLLAISLLFGALGIAAIHFGRAGMRIVLLPSLLLLFAVPMPAPLLADVLYRFQLWTAEAAGWMLYLLGEAAFVSGDQVLLAEDHFQVIEGCSGLRSVQTLTMVALLLVELFGRRGWHAVVIVALAPFVAFGLNGFRVLALILNPHSEVVAIHNLQGVMILLVGLAILYGVDGLLERFEDPGADALPGGAATAPAAEAPGPWLRAAAPLATLTAMLGLSAVVEPWAVPAAEEVSPRDLPRELAGRTGEPLQTDRTFLGTVGYRALLDSRYEGEGPPVDVFLLVGDLAQRFRSPISPKTIPPGSGWILERRGALEREGARAPTWSVMRSGTRRVLVHHWYEGTGGRLDEIVRGLAALDASPWRRPRDVLVVRISTDIVGATSGALDAARRRLEEFEQALEPELDRVRARLARKPLS